MSRVDFAVVGVPKSATTMIHYILGYHPDISMQREEDTAFLHEDWEEKLQPLFAHAAKGNRRFCGLKRPDMIFKLDALRRMKAHNPAIKTIVVLRHPVERLVAQYFHMICYSYLPLLDFARGMPLLLSGEMQKDWWRAFEVLDFSHYRRPIEALLEIIDAANVHVMLHDDVRADIFKAAKSVTNFLGLGFDENNTIPDGKPQKVVYSMERLRFLRLRNEATMELDAFGRAVKVLGHAMTAEERAWEATVRAFDDKVMARSFIDDEPPRIAPDLWEHLYERYRPDIEFVEDLIGRRLPAWHCNPFPETTQ